MQVDGFSLDAQKEKLRKYAEYQDMIIAGDYCDEGKSGKNVEGRPQFLRMLRDIESGKDDVTFVLVFKLSRFGRNAADVLTSLQRMQDYGVNLICVEDGIDSSKDSGKLMISVLSAVAEIERENILVQTMEGRRQKAREGRWNGGFAPYGYKLENGQLLIAEDEAETIRLIYDKYIHTSMGVSKIAIWLNGQGYKKKKRQNNTLDAFSASFVKGVLDNPVYCGKMPYGRRHNEKIQGTHNQYHIVKQAEYMLHDGEHEAIISEEDWQLAHAKRVEKGVKQEKTHSLEHEHILSGILCCPCCGSGMYGNVNRKKNKDNGEYYRDYFYYQCKHRKMVDGHHCDYKKQWGEDMIDAAVEEVIRKLVQSPKFADSIKEKIGSRIDTGELEQELGRLRKHLRQLSGTKDRLGQQIDALDYDDPHYERKLQDLQERQNKIYDDIASAEADIAEAQMRLNYIDQRKVSRDNVYQFLLYFDRLYDEFSDLEKKEFMKSFIERVEIFPERQPDGRILRRIDFRFPVFFEGKEVDMLNWDTQAQVETVVLMSQIEV
jgi:site-specific DNA recombinase